MMKNAVRALTLAAVAWAGAACSQAQDAPGASDASAATEASATMVASGAAEAQAACHLRAGDLASRPSPPDSATADMGGDLVKVCYGAPSARGRQLVGGDAHPYGTRWRLGANEATSIHLPFAASVAGVSVPAGSYSLYAVVGETSWDIVVNGVSDRWGVPINDEVTASDVGSGQVAVAPNEHVETLAMAFEDVTADAATLVVTWEGYRVDVPVLRAS